MGINGWILSIFVIGLFGFFYFSIAIFKWRGKRTKAFALLLSDVVATFVAMLAAAALFDPPQVNDLAGFLDGVSPATSAKAETTVSKATKLMPPEPYCNWVVENDRIEREANAQFGESADGDQYAKKQEWRAEKLEQLSKDLEKALSSHHLSIMTKADANHWTRKCDAQAKGLVTVELADTENVDTQRAVAAEEAILLHYISSIGAGSSEFFNPEYYSTARCRNVEKQGSRFVGCQLLSMSSLSAMDWYVIGSVDDAVVLALVNESILESRFGPTRKLRTPDGEMTVRLGQFVEFPTPNYFMEAEKELEEALQP